MEIKVMINSKEAALQVTADEFLAETLRNYGLLGVRKGCDTTSCGLCTVWLDGKPTLSCAVLSARVNGRKITTIEGVEKKATEFAHLLAGEGADQCGYCSPGFIMTVLAMKDELKNPTEQEIQHYLTGNLCRCTGYAGQLRAIKKYLESD